MFGDYLNTVISVLSGIRIMDIVDIAIVAFAIYKIIDFIRKTRAQQLLKGLLILVAIMFLSSIFNLYTVHFLLYNGLIYGFTAIIVIFIRSCEEHWNISEGANSSRSFLSAQIGIKMK